MNNIAKTVEIIGGRDIIQRCNILLQQGVYIDIEGSMTLQEFLTGRCGVSETVVSGKIKTIFLNSKTVDDIATAHVGAGDKVGLSGAMPGLVGAVFRQKSVYSSFRGSITYSQDNNGINNAITPGMVMLKVFNTVMNEVASSVFTRGFFVPVETCIWFFTIMGGMLQTVDVSLRFNGKKAKMKHIFDELMSVDNQLLYLVFHESNG